MINNETGKELMTVRYYNNVKCADHVYFTGMTDGISDLRITLYLSSNVTASHIIPIESMLCLDYKANMRYHSATIGDFMTKHIDKVFEVIDALRNLYESMGINITGYTIYSTRGRDDE